MNGESISLPERKGYGVVLESRGKQIFEPPVAQVEDLPGHVTFEGKLFERSFLNYEQECAVYHCQISNDPHQSEGLAVGLSGAILEHWENDGKDQERAVAEMKVAAEYRKKHNNV